MPRPKTTEANRLRMVLRVVMGIAIAGVMALAVYLVREVRRVPSAPPTRERTSDVVVPHARPWQPGGGILGYRTPTSQPQPAPTGAGEIPIPPERQLKPVKRILPKDLPDPSNPPQYTRPLASPPAHPVPPNPFVPPPIRVNPDRSKGPAY
jgi:hypothetical protein